jgi:hypothetical protein
VQKLIGVKNGLEGAFRETDNMNFEDLDDGDSADSPIHQLTCGVAFL